MTAVRRVAVGIDAGIFAVGAHGLAQKTNVNPYVLRLLARPYAEHPDFPRQ